MVHMPSHIYYRIGRYFDALAVNKDAVAADENYLKASDAPMGVYRLGYYPHNVHFILASATMSGDGPAAIAAAEKLAKVIPDDRLEKAPGAQTIKSAIYFAHAQFSTPDTILALPDPSGAGPYVSAMWHYARGVAQVRKGDLGAAAAEANAIATLGRTGNFDALKAAGIPALEVLALAQNVVEARIALAKGDSESAIAKFAAAAALQDSCAIPNRLIGITRCGSRSRPRCCRLAGSTRRSTSSGRRSRARRTTAGPITGLPSSTRRAAIRRRHTTPKLSSRIPGSATKRCSTYRGCRPSSQVRRGGFAHIRFRSVANQK
jgi:hypothetical protein